MSYFGRGQYTEAEELLEPCLDMMKAVLEEDTKYNEKFICNI